jgi:hypothetical protein
MPSLESLAGQGGPANLEETASPEEPAGPITLTKSFWWALVVSNHRPPPCKGEESESPSSADTEKPNVLTQKAYKRVRTHGNPSFRGFHMWHARGGFHTGVRRAVLGQGPRPAGRSTASPSMTFVGPASLYSRALWLVHGTREAPRPVRQAALRVPGAHSPRLLIPSPRRCLCA